MRRRWITAFGVVLALVGVALAAFADGPNIGLIYARAKYAKLEEDGKDAQKLYRQAIEENGGVVVAISQTFDIGRVESQLALLDGVVLPGGIDVDPKFYGEERHEKLEETDAGLDELEFNVLGYAKEHVLPVLGVCRGHQVLNVYYGGSLIQDIPTEHKSEVAVKHRYPKESKEKREHPISIEKGSILRELFGTDRLTVNTFHHQAVKKPAPGFVVTARADDGIVEAIEHTGAPFILGLQFHPEKLRPHDPRFNAPFKRLVGEAEKIKAARTRGRGNE